jgi:lipopolysaccharide/colanic/teichoic acid biosynthesis glycosyltransferase
MITGLDAADLSSRSSQNMSGSSHSAVSLEHVRSIPVAHEPEARKTSTAGVAPQNRSERVDRIVNITLASLGLVLAAPIMLVFAVLVKLTSPGPIFYAQARVGWIVAAMEKPVHDRRTRDLGGRAFMILKFRTMRVDAERTAPSGR